MRCSVLFRDTVIGETVLLRDPGPPWADPRALPQTVPGLYRTGTMTPTPVYAGDLAEACRAQFDQSFATIQAQLQGMTALGLTLRAPDGTPIPAHVVLIVDMRAMVAEVAPEDATDPQLLTVMAMLVADVPDLQQFAADLKARREQGGAPPGPMAAT